MDIVKRERTLGRQDSKPKARTRKVKLWTRLSPLYLFRVLRDTYVRGCVTFGNSSKVNAVAHSSAFRITSDENSFSRSNSRNLRNDHPVSAQEILDLSAKFSREVLEQESVQSGRKHLTPVITGHNGTILLCLSYSTYELEHQRLAARWSFRISFCPVKFLFHHQKLEPTGIQYMQPLNLTGRLSVPQPHCLRGGKLEEMTLLGESLTKSDVIASNSVVRSFLGNSCLGGGQVLAGLAYGRMALRWDTAWAIQTAMCRLLLPSVAVNNMLGSH